MRALFEAVYRENMVSVADHMVGTRMNRRRRVWAVTGVSSSMPDDLRYIFVTLKDDVVDIMQYCVDLGMPRNVVGEIAHVDISWAVLFESPTEGELRESGRRYTA